VNLLWIAIAAAVAIVITSATDWLFSGVLFHSKYLEFPGTWRSSSGEPETGRIVWSTILSALSCLSFIGLMVTLNLIELHLAIQFAIAVWLAIVVPLIATNFVWIRMHIKTAIAHAIGWLVRFLICAGSVAFIYRGHN
jgi:hypothetical protein